MSIPATTSALDVAYWFFNRAEQDNVYLEPEKIHHLLFMAQNKYAKKHANTLLIPCVFLCDDYGFFEPTLKKIFSQGLPYIQPAKFKNEVSHFLEQIWQEYGRLSLAHLTQMIINMPCYKECSLSGDPITNALTSFNERTEKTEFFNSEKTIHETPRKKMLFSQNGPVLVSQWTPRKINTSTDKEFFHD